MASEETPVEAASADVSIRLKYITDAFNGIRGLYLVAWGIWFAMLQLCILEDRSWWWNSLGFFGSSAAFLATMLLIPKYYTRRFGVYRPNPAPPLKPKKKEIVIGVLIVAGFYLFSWALEHVFHLGAELTGLAYFVLIPGFVLIHPWRKVWSVVEVGLCAMVVALLMMVGFLPALGLISAAQLKAFHAASPGILMATTGVCEYIVIRRLLPKPAPGPGDE